MLAMLNRRRWFCRVLFWEKRERGKREICLLYIVQGAMIEINHDQYSALPPSNTSHSHSLTHSQWKQYSQEDLIRMDTMIKRLFKKGSEQIVRKYEYYRVALQQEVDERQRVQNQRAMEQMIQQQHNQSDFTQPQEFVPPLYEDAQMNSHAYRIKLSEPPRIRNLHPRRLSDSDFQGLEETFV